ncbi:MAG: hypothetical protein HZR80_19580 [Candidatus Heimdallarchaeota archaeon]
MSYSFDDTIDLDEEIEYKKENQLRSLTDDFVFCPKCGKKNSFTLSKTGSELKYFCERCSERLNDIWNEFYKELISIVNCKTCKQPTFDEYKYCTSCGSLQKKVARKRSREISKQIPDKIEYDTDARAILLECCCDLGGIGTCASINVIGHKSESQGKLIKQVNIAISISLIIGSLVIVAFYLLAGSSILSYDLLYVFVSIAFTIIVMVPLVTFIIQKSKKSTNTKSQSNINFESQKE